MGSLSLSSAYNNNTDELKEEKIVSVYLPVNQFSVSTTSRGHHKIKISEYIPSFLVPLGKVVKNMHPVHREIDR